MYLRESVAHDRALAAERRQRNLRQEVERARDRAERAERDALEQLRTSYIAEAQAHRVSGQPGRRFASLEVLAKAAALRPDLDVRNEVIACLPLLDLRLVRRWEFQARQERVFFEPTLDRYAVVNAGGNVSLRQWTDDAERNRLSAPSAHAGGGLALFSPDGRYLRVAYEKSMASHVWDLTDGALLLSTPHGHGEFTEDSRCFAVAEPASGITFYDLATRAKVGTLGAGSQFAFFRFDRAGRQLAAKRLGTNAEIVVIDLPTEAVTARLSDAQSVLDFAWHADGRHLAVANDVSQTVAIWDTRDGSVRQRLEGHQGSVVSLQFTRQGDLLFTSGWDGRIRVWDFQSGRELLNTSGAGRLLLSPDDRRLAVASWDGDRSWCFEVALSSGLRVIREAERGRDGGERVCFSRDGRVLARTFRGRVKLHDAATGRELAALDEHPIREVVADPQDNSFWLSGTGVWYRVPTGGHAGEGGVGLGALERIELPEDLVLGAIAADGRTLLAWRVRDERCVILGGGALRQQVEMKEPHPGIRYLALSPEGRWAATGAWQERVVKVWDAHSGDLLQTIATPDMASVAFSPDGRWLVIGSADYRFLEVGTWGEVRRVTRPPMEQFPPAMAFSRDGRMLALCHAERSIRLVDPHTGQELATLEAPDPWPVRTLSVNPDATQLAAGGEGTAEYHIWDLHQIRGQLAKLGLDWVATR
jgi:WD40 repeat protein